MFLKLGVLVNCKYLYAATADERFDVELDHDDRHLLDNEYSWVSSVVGDKWRVIPAVK